MFGFSLPVSSQLILKYAYMLDVMIPHIVHITYFDYTLSILQNFEKTIWLQKTWMKPIGTFCFLKVLKNWQSVVKICHVDNVRYQNI